MNLFCFFLFLNWRVGLIGIVVVFLSLLMIGGILLLIIRFVEFWWVLRLSVKVIFVLFLGFMLILVLLGIKFLLGYVLDMIVVCEVGMGDRVWCEYVDDLIESGVVEGDIIVYMVYLMRGDEMKVKCC